MFGCGRVETRTGDFEAAERTTRAAAERAAEIGDNWFYVLASIDLARAVCELGRPAECLEILEESEQHPAPPDFEVIVVKRATTRALALARLGRLEEAEPVAREAVGLGRRDAVSRLPRRRAARPGRGAASRRQARGGGGRPRGGGRASTSARATSSPPRRRGPRSQSWAERRRRIVPQDVLDFRILGPLEVSAGARLVSLGGPRQQALLACLLIRAGEPVAADWLIEQLWADGSGRPRGERCRWRSLGFARRSVTRP